MIHHLLTMMLTRLPSIDNPRPRGMMMTNPVFVVVLQEPGDSQDNGFWATVGRIVSTVQQVRPFSAINAQLLLYGAPGHLACIISGYRL
jgi:hypothetical protein